MIEVKLLQYLKSQITDAEVYGEVPANKPEKYVVFEKTGLSEKNHISMATIAIRSIAPTLYESLKLDEEVRHAMESFDTVTNISGVSLNSDTNWTNTTTKEHRQQAVFLITYMEE
ncbi:MAG: hypothetical protein LKE64_12050 [Solobacterium sp.]|jgi:hypothetical protein|nr:hypothetical protein [Solobacterium sp.]MCH4047989.1 hypothetical protein [Solobacterium sp.]MCH4075425.1 hypothetical protein [Solobacterium sp.]MCI1313725.1 hypothetical protein [Solobacterium sp.]MCI1407122.1 hypothetical protein [Solobacterium sp.]